MHTACTHSSEVHTHAHMHFCTPVYKHTAIVTYSVAGMCMATS